MNPTLPSPSPRPLPGQKGPPSTPSPAYFILQREIQFPRRRWREGGLAALLALSRAESMEAEGPSGGPAHMHAGPHHSDHLPAKCVSELSPVYGMNNPQKEKKLHALRYSSEFYFQ